MAGVPKWLKMVCKKPSRVLINSSTCKHTHWYENQSCRVEQKIENNFFFYFHQSWPIPCTCSAFFDINMPNVLLKNDANSGFNGGCCSKKAYNFCNKFWCSINSVDKADLFVVKISQAMFEYLKRIASATSVGGSFIIKSTNCSIISTRWKLFGWERKKRKLN